ncbi:MAG: DUF1684 domain-containing protein [Bacteroidetes bacterium]|nr:DUF1684 domain-containing protein [Bacteroidota bacterium]MBU1114930.1 DUF1684 domain-containing protein [Bacteroidota bacterium]MBU1798685.1 DUF1684 domain-containing protein [Bacteroidota bacterium]
MKKVIFILMLMFLTFGCSQKPDTEYVKSIKEFHKERIERLKKPDSWLSLVGLYWLKEGKNTFGSDKLNDIILPNNFGSDNLGIFTLKDSTVTVEIIGNQKVFCNDTIVTSQIMFSDLTDNPTILKFGSFSWFAIQRGDKFGIRVKDSEAPLLKEFSDIEMFEIDSTWKIPAEFIEYETPKEVLTPTAIGTFEKTEVLGYLAFTIGNQFFTVEPSASENGFFLVFGDKSNGEETYGAGRFLYIEKSNSAKQLYIDINKAYNPPCVFTKYATCPLPRKENNLNIKVLAGEKNFHSKYH